ncbi:MAG: family 43 glycosylhydrolase [Butyrivibrio sp.]|nr:family 43 glycosylhydrolase [Butyrivibrio sp.]
MGYADLGDTFRNPIIFADYSDPDVIRVGDTFYMTASSFNYTPGLPILISKDLVNWELVNYALKNIGQVRFNIPRHSQGVWAPAIRYHEGMFYIYYGMPDEGFYVVRTRDPLGEWEEPVCILEGKGLIDSCPFWDDDGKAYVIHGYAKSRIGFKSILGIFEMSPDGLKAISEDHFIFNGNDPDHPAVTIEGPKVYKRNGYYYIWAPAGGVKEGYQVVLRSRNIRGSYEIRTVMDTGNTVINGPHQGGLVDTVNGDEWFIHFQDRGLYGRICHLQPVHWNGDWPVVGVEYTSDASSGVTVPDTCTADRSRIGEPVYEHAKPDCEIRSESGTDTYFPDFGKYDIYRLPDTYTNTLHANVTDIACNTDKAESTGLLASDQFPGGKYGLQWQWMGDHKEEFYGKICNSKGSLGIRNELAAADGDSADAEHAADGLRLFCLNPSGDEKPIIWRSANVLTQKLIYPVFEAAVNIDATGLLEGERAGVVMTGGQYLTAYIEKKDGEFYVCVAESEGSDTDKQEVIKNRWKLGELLSDGTQTDFDRRADAGICSEAESNLAFRMIFTYKDREFDSQQLYFQNVKKPMFGENPSLSIELGIPYKKDINTAKETAGDHSQSVSGCNPVSYVDLGVNYTPSDHTWVGAKLGIYALSGGDSAEGKPLKYGHADFTKFIVNVINRNQRAQC